MFHKQYLTGIIHREFTNGKQEVSERLKHIPITWGRNISLQNISKNSQRH